MKKLWLLISSEGFLGIISVSILIGMFFYIGWSFIYQIPSADEMIFLRVTKHLPKYESHMEWYTLDGKTDPNTVLPPTPFYKVNYDLPVWLEPPLDSVLTYPLVKLFFKEDNNGVIYESLKKFRMLALFMYWFCIMSVLYLIRKKTQSNKVLFFSLLPLLASIPFFIKWAGMNWWYYDTFVYVFLCIALLMRGTKFQKYVYIPLILMVGSKIVGFILLFPFIIENKKTLWCLFGIVPYFLQCWITTGDPMYIYHIWLAHENIVLTNITSWQDIPIISFIMNRFYYVTVSVKKCFLLLFVMIVPLVDWFRNNPMNKCENWFIPIMFLTACIYGLALEGVYYHMMAMVIIGIWMVGESLISYRRLNATR